MTAQPQSVIAYIRVSSTAQSVKRQRGDLTDDIGNHHLVVEKEFTDEGIGASILSRKVRDDYEALVALIASGRADGKTIWLSEASRMSRNMEQFGPLRKLCREHGVKWFLSSKGRVFDLANHADLAAVTDMINAAEQEIFTLRTRIQSGVREALRDQRPTGKTPYGYQREYDRLTKRLVAQQAHPVFGPVVTEVAARYAAGEPARAIARDLNDRRIAAPGDTLRVLADPAAELRYRWSEGTVVKVAINPTYLGKRRYRGTQVVLTGTHDGAWPALIDQETHMLAVARSEQARKSYIPRSAQHLLTGVAHCAKCPRGERAPVGYITTSNRRGKTDYACLKGCLRLTSSEVDDRVLKVLAGVFARDDFAEAFAAGETIELVNARQRAARARNAWEDLATSGVSPQMIARLEPPLLAAIAEADQAVNDLSRPSVLRDLLTEPAERRMEFFLGLDMVIRRKVLAEILDVTLHPRGQAAGRNRPIKEFVRIVSRR